MKIASLFLLSFLLISIASCKKGGIASHVTGKYRGPIQCTYQPTTSRHDTSYATIIAVSYVNETAISINNTTLYYTLPYQFNSATKNGITATASFDSAFTSVVYRDQSGSVYGCTFSGFR